MTSGSRSLAVLDVETVPCADALSLSTARSRGGHGRTALHRLVSVSVLTAREHSAGFGDVDLRAFAHPEHGERDMLGFADLLLPDPDEPGSVLVTYNGRHDLRVLRHRACSGWMFDLPRLGGWCRGAGEHVDMMLEGGGGVLPGWSLADLCAGLGIAIRRGSAGRSVHRLHVEGRHRAVLEHNVLDVVGTFLAYAYDRSFRSGDGVFAATAWLAVAGATEGILTRDPNVEAIADHHLVSHARSVLTGRSAPP